MQAEPIFIERKKKEAKFRLSSSLPSEHKNARCQICCLPQQKLVLLARSCAAGAGTNESVQKRSKLNLLDIEAQTTQKEPNDDKTGHRQPVGCSCKLSSQPAIHMRCDLAKRKLQRVDFCHAHSISSYIRFVWRARVFLSSSFKCTLRFEKKKQASSHGATAFEQRQCLL